MILILIVYLEIQAMITDILKSKYCWTYIISIVTFAKYFKTLEIFIFLIFFGYGIQLIWLYMYIITGRIIFWIHINLFDYVFKNLDLYLILVVTKLIWLFCPKQYIEIALHFPILVQKAQLNNIAVFLVFWRFCLNPLSFLAVPHS